MMSCRAHSVRLLWMASAAALGGWIASRLDLPLAWLVGALVTTAIISVVGPAIRVPRFLYRSGQLVIAVAVGLSVSPDVTQVLRIHLPTIVAGALISIAIGRLLSDVLARYSRMDRTTAYFAMVPAGISEMAEQSAKRGADAATVAALHTVRVILVVIILPSAMILLFGRGAIDVPASAVGFDIALLVALAFGLLAALAGSWVGMPAAWFVAPMLAVAILSGAELVSSHAPEPLLAIAQVALGLALGSRFRRGTIKHLHDTLSVAIPLMLFHASAMAAVAIFLSLPGEFEERSLILGLATGGTAEMVLTAKMLATDAALVAAYQVARGLLGNLLADPIYRMTIRGA